MSPPWKSSRFRRHLDVDHAKLVRHAERYLRDALGCVTVITEPSSHHSECPDAIGWERSGLSHLIECKSNRKDFWDDIRPDRKPFRRDESGMGQVRYYMAPAGVLSVPAVSMREWGLIELRGVHARLVLEPERRWKANKAAEVRLLSARMSKLQKFHNKVQRNNRQLALFSKFP